MINYKRINDFIIAMLKAELIMQGHKDTGALIDSFEGKVMTLPNSIVLEILMDEHGIYVNDGRKKAKSETEYVPIGVLVDWVERKALASGEKEVLSVAYAIREKIYKEGSPTNNSYSFSKNGRRKGFIDFVIENKLDDVYNELEQQVFEDYDTAIVSMVKEFNLKNK